MDIRKRLGFVLLWLTGPVLIFIGININDPYLVWLRGPGSVGLVAASLAVAAALLLHGFWRGISGQLLVLLWLLPSVSMFCATVFFELRKQNVLHTEPERAHSLGLHFVVGYSSFAEIARLAEKGLIGGVYITKHNVAGRSIAAVKAEIAALQARRRSAGLPPLIVAADQEGGIVSHLSPPLDGLPALATLADLPADLRARTAEAFGRTHGRELASLGVTQNFAPVLDLRLDAGRHLFDYHTMIGQRAIAADPAVVSDIARAYVRGLEAAGVEATVKHFPGLGRLHTDTHHFQASLDATMEELEASDWRPFRDVLANSKAQLMIGHVNLTAIDPDRPASHSLRVVDGLIRKRWNYQGVIITDDLVMGAIYGYGVCAAVVEALNAGVDLLLVAYDGAQYYRIFTCASEAAARGTLDPGMLQRSEARLKASSPEAALRQRVTSR
jgi:beta-N-acetylhexosaminidase